MLSTPFSSAVLRYTLLTTFASASRATGETISSAAAHGVYLCPCASVIAAPWAMLPAISGAIRATV